MGCDIHMYPEWWSDDSTDRLWVGGWPNLNPGRDYNMFGLLAGVRSTEDPVYPVRGLPSSPPLGWYAKHDSVLYVVRDNGTVYDGAVTVDKAEEWIKHGVSQWASPSQETVMHPDWHTHSWLTPTEYAKVLQRYRQLYTRSCGAEYRAVLAALRSMVKSGYVARVVFWFDN